MDIVWVQYTLIFCMQKNILSFQMSKLVLPPQMTLDFSLESINCNKELTARGCEEFLSHFLPCQFRNDLGLGNMAWGWEWEFSSQNTGAHLHLSNSNAALFQIDLLHCLSPPIHHSVWRLSWNKQKRYITLEPISIAYNVLNRLIYCIWDLGKWLNFYASLISREGFQPQLFYTHNVNLTYLIFSSLIENLLYNLMAPGCRSHSLAAIQWFAQGLLMREKRAHVTWTQGDSLPSTGVWDRAQGCNLFS